MKKLLAVILAVFLLCSCSGNNEKVTGESEVKDGNTLYLTGYIFNSSNPLDVRNNLNRNIFSLIYKSLYKNDESGRPEGVLAESAVCSSDNLSWEITVKDNISFHNGEPFSAKDVAATINYLLTNESVYSSNVRNIESVRAVSADRAVITLSSPAVNFPAQLTFPIIPSGGFGPSGFNGTGDYKVKSYVKMKKILLSAKEDVPMGKNGVKFIEIQLVADKDVAAYANQSGMSDVYISEELLQTTTDINKSRISSKEYVSNRFGFLLLNLEKPCFSDINVRKAINMSVNRTDITENILFSRAVNANTPIKPGYYLFSDIKEAVFDIEAAKTLLLENGYVTDITTGIFEKEMTYEKKAEPVESAEEETPPAEPETITEVVPLSFEILVNSENSFRIQTANSISSSLKNAGIEAKVKIVSFEDYEKAISEKEYDAVLGSMILSEDNDLSEFALRNKMTGIDSDEGDAAINNLKLALDDEQKREAYINLNEFFETQIPLISLYFEKGSLHYAKRVSGEFSPTSYFMFSNIENWQLASK